MFRIYWYDEAGKRYTKDFSSKEEADIWAVLQDIKLRVLVCVYDNGGKIVFGNPADEEEVIG